MSQPVPPENFSAIEDAATHPVAEDTSARQELKEQYSDEERDNSKAHRRMRWWAFGVLGTVCIAYLITLLIALARIFFCDILPKVIPTGSDWHTLVLVGIALVVFAAVPLSLAMALVRMISEGGPDAEKPSLKTPQLEAIKIAFELLKSAKG